MKPICRIRYTRYIGYIVYTADIACTPEFCIRGTHTLATFIFSGWAEPPPLFYLLSFRPPPAIILAPAIFTFALALHWGDAPSTALLNARE